MSFFDRKIQEIDLWCHICRRDTRHSRAIGLGALFTCRDNSHPHPNKHSQESGTQMPQPTKEDLLRRADQMRKEGIGE